MGFTHVRLCLDTACPAGIEFFERFTGKLSDLAKQVGGIPAGRRENYERRFSGFPDLRSQLCEDATSHMARLSEMRIGRGRRGGNSFCAVMKSAAGRRFGLGR
jgi:hypothetical protein